MYVGANGEVGTRSSGGIKSTIVRVLCVYVFSFFCPGRTRVLCLPAQTLEGCVALRMKRFCNGFSCKQLLCTYVRASELVTTVRSYLVF